MPFSWDNPTIFEVPVFLPIALALVLATAPEDLPAPRPEWLTTLPQASGKLYALGTADLGTSESEARRQAGERARLEVVARLRASVKGETAVVTQTTERTSGGVKTGAGERNTRDLMQVGVKAEDLPGLSVEQFFVDATGNTVFALGCLDAHQAKSSLEARLQTVRQTRVDLKDETSRRARWRLRSLKPELDRIRDLAALLSSAGLLGDFPDRLRNENQALEARLTALETANLPALDLASATFSVRSNADLPGGVQDYLEARVHESGPTIRSAGADFVLDIRFAGSDKGPEFIFAEMTFAAGALYRLDATLRVLDRSGAELTRPVKINLAQAGNPEGLVDQFRRQIDRRIPRLLESLQEELQ